MMNIKEVRNELLNEKYYDIDHPSGLKILVMPKENYSSTYAIFATKYGSIDTMIQMSDGSFKEIPEGTAHFLEHKLFESEDLDAFERFAKTGASANAYTSFERTGYLFSCSANFKKNLEILLDFVQNPYFTQATVEKEQGIIGQEIDMYKDAPDWEVMFNCLRTMYHNLPVRIDIAGTQESIAQITAKTLYGCYDNFYNLHNMVLAVAGNADVDEIVEVADKVLKPVEGKMAQRKVIDEPEEVIDSYIEEKLSVATPQFMFGFKESWDTPERTTKEEISMEILLDMISGQSSELYKRLFDGKLINNSFGFEYFTGFGYSCVLFAGESNDPKKVAEEIVGEIGKFRETGFDKTAFERTKKKLYGRMIMGMNDIEGLANNMAVSYFAGEDVFTDFEIFKTVTLDDVNDIFKKTLDENRSVLSVINPN
ncbi:MAG: pitrilysin family protein [Oscillospiraceae bacterium]|nr:insulinase family protein [Ruminococcus sp.]MDY3089069.1 pitrilysin family protein [Oscillospiraceae bacterium]